MPVARKPKEYKEQQALVRYLRRRGFFVYAIPNHKEQRADIGAVAGMPDLQIVLEDKKVIWVEMKRQKGGRVSEAQKQVHALLEGLGHIVILGFGAKDCVAKLDEYLD